MFGYAGFSQSIIIFAVSLFACNVPSEVVAAYCHTSFSTVKYHMARNFEGPNFSRMALRLQFHKRKNCYFHELLNIHIDIHKAYRVLRILFS